MTTFAAAWLVRFWISVTLAFLAMCAVNLGWALGGGGWDAPMVEQVLVGCLVGLYAMRTPWAGNSTRP